MFLLSLCLCLCLCEVVVIAYQSVLIFYHFEMLSLCSTLFLVGYYSACLSPCKPKLVFCLLWIFPHQHDTCSSLHFVVYLKQRKLHRILCLAGVTKNVRWNRINMFCKYIVCWANKSNFGFHPFYLHYYLHFILIILYLPQGGYVFF